MSHHSVVVSLWIMHLSWYILLFLHDGAQDGTCWTILELELRMMCIRHSCIQFHTMVNSTDWQIIYGSMDFSNPCMNKKIGYITRNPFGSGFSRTPYINILLDMDHFLPFIYSNFGSKMKLMHKQKISNSSIHVLTRYYVLTKKLNPCIDKSFFVNALTKIITLTWFSKKHEHGSAWNFALQYEQREYLNHESQLENLQV